MDRGRCLMLRYISLRLLLALGVLWAAYTVTFLVLYMIPGDPVSATASGGRDGGATSQERIDELREAYGFNDPLYVQYFNHLVAAGRGDFRTSVQTGQTVLTAVGQVIASTLQLALLALVIAVLGGGGLALLATYTNTLWHMYFLLTIPPVDNQLRS